MEIGLYTFADMTPDPATGRMISVEQRYAEILAAADLADQAGIAIYAFGEHHRLDIAISSPAIVMAAVAACCRPWLPPRLQQSADALPLSCWEKQPRKV